MYVPEMEQLKKEKAAREADRRKVSKGGLVVVWRNVALYGEIVPTCVIVHVYCR